MKRILSKSTVNRINTAGYLHFACIDVVKASSASLEWRFGTASAEVVEVALKKTPEQTYELTKNTLQSLGQATACGLPSWFIHSMLKLMSAPRRMDSNM